MPPGSWKTTCALLVGASLLLGGGIVSAERPDQPAGVASSPSSVPWHCLGTGLPDGPYCVHPEHFELDVGEELLTAEGGHRLRSGEWQRYEHLPRSPERPAEYDLYRYPVSPALGGRSVVSGYDLDLPDDRQRRSARLRHVGHGGVDLPQVRGADVRMVALEHQEGGAEVLFTGPVFGRTVLLLHRVREAVAGASPSLREYVVLYGHLESIAPGLTIGGSVEEDDLLGAVGDSGSPGLVHLHFEARRMREGHDALTVLREKGPNALVTSAFSIPTDPRNVLPLR